MNPLVINSYTPQAEITAISDGGRQYALTQDAVSLTTVRSVDGGAGSFSLQLTAAKDKRGLMWTDKIRAMDYLEIRAGNRRLPNGKLPVRMRAFVDSSSESLIMPKEGGPQRGILITGRDYTKLFQSQNVQYLWSQTLPADGSFPGLDMNFGVPSDGTAAIKDIAQTILDDVFLGKGGKTGEPFLPLYRGVTGINVPDIISHFSVPDNFKAQYFTINAWTGPFWNLIDYLSSPPLGELFMYDSEAGPILVLRVVPLRDISGKIISPAQEPELPTIEIDPAMVSAYDLGRTDQQVLNYFFAMSDAASSGGTVALNYATQGLDLFHWSPYVGSGKGDNPYWSSRSARKFGLKPLNIQTPWIQLWTQTDDSARQNAAVLSNYLGLAYDHNESLIGGEMTCHGSEHYIPGRYVKFSDALFYLEKVTETFNFIGSSSPSWAASLYLTRGQSVSGIAEQPEIGDTTQWTQSQEYQAGGHPAE